MIPHPPEPPQAHDQGERREGDEHPEDLKGVGRPLAVRQDPLGLSKLISQPPILSNQTLI